MSDIGSPRIAATRLVIVGGGYTGAVLAMNAARIGTEPLDITMVEPAAEPGRGIAYGTQDPSHRINVPSDRMNLFKAEPDRLRAGCTTREYCRIPGAMRETGISM